MNESHDYIVPQKSSFVTILAIIFIVISGFSLLAFTAQITLIPIIFQRLGIQGNLQKQMDNGSMPSVVSFMLRYNSLFITISLLASIVKMIASIGLLMRKNWARILFIIVMFFAIAFRIFGFVMQFFTVPTLPNMPQSNEQFLQMVMLVTRIFVFFFTAGFCVLYGWIIYKLLSEKIRREFIPESQSNNYDNES